MKQSLTMRMKMSEATKLRHEARRGGPAKHKDARFDLRHRLWRAAVLERDGNVCQICGATESLVAHHIEHFDAAPELRYVTQNGQTLCRACHPRVHAGQVRTPEQRAKIGEGVRKAKATKKAAADPSSC